MVRHGGTRRLVAVLALAVVIATGSPARSTPARSTYVTVNDCEAHSLSTRTFQDWQNIPPDCHCPPGYTTLPGGLQHVRPPLCVGLHEPRPYHDGCVESGTATDYYTLDAEELASVQQYLAGRGLTGWWISARRLVRYGGLVRRLPGPDWNTPLEQLVKRPVVLPPPDDSTSVDGHDCGAVHLQHPVRIAYRNCSDALPLLCLYRERTLEQLHCHPDEYTTRYAALQHFCYRVAKDRLANETVRDSYDIDSNRKQQLLLELRDSSRDCRGVTNIISVVRRRSDGRSSSETESLLPVAATPDGFVCVAQQHQRLEPAASLARPDGTGPGVYLHFDRARHKLFATVYGERWFWRAAPDDTSPFGCFTNVDDEQLKRARVRVARPDWQLGPNRTLYAVKLEEDGPPRTYWCEAHLVPNFAHITSEPVLAHRKTHCRRYFAVTIELLLKGTAGALRLKDYDAHITRQHVRQARPELRPLLAAIKSLRVKRVEHVWRAATSGWYTARLLLHVAMHCDKRWERQLAALEPDDPNEIGMPATHLHHYRMRQNLTRALESLESGTFRFVGANSTEYCLPDSLQVRPGGNVWWAARLGETVAPRNLCLVEPTGLPLTRRCLGDYLYGCAWDWDPDGRICSRRQHPTTRLLYGYSVLGSTLDRTALGEMLRTADAALATPDTVLPADLYYIAQTLAHAGPDGLLDGESFCGVTHLLSRLMYVNETTVVWSQAALNTTNVLLDASETIAGRLAALMTGARYDCQVAMEAPHYRPPTDDGTVLFRTARLIVLIADPAVANITGLALFRSGSSAQEQQAMEEDDDFSSYTLRYLYMNQSVESLLEESDLEIGSFVPQHVLDRLDELQETFASSDGPEDAVPDPDTSSTDVPAAARPPLRVVITIYYNDHAFRETQSGTVARPNTKIISVTVPGYGSRMPDEIPIYTRAQPHSSPGGRCGYWSFEAPPNATGPYGRWSYDECRVRRVAGPRTLCACYHLTSFARLTMDTQMVETVGVSQKFIADQGTLALDVITAIGCALSLVGVVGILLTALLFPCWRAKASSKILLQLSGAIAVEMIVIFLEGPDIDQNRISRIECALLGSVFHYIILVTFMWMLVTAYLQFMRYVKVLGRLRPAHFILKATVVCWGGPLVPVVACLCYDHTLYLKRDNLTDICYPHGRALWYGLLLPISAIIAVNLVSFVFVLYNICTIPGNLTKTADHAMTLAQLRLSVFLFFLLGLPWIFGMLTTGTEDKLFAYLFCLTAPVQGFVLFVYFVVMDPTARRYWSRRLQRCPCVSRPAAKQTDGEPTTTSANTSFNTAKRTRVTAMNLNEWDRKKIFRHAAPQSQHLYGTPYGQQASPYQHHHQHQQGDASEYAFTAGSPVEDGNIEYERKGGCFVSICRGISIAVLIFVFIFFMAFTIFFSTKYAYEHKPNLTLEDFLNHRAYLIDKRARIPKHVIPKHYRLFIHPVFNETDHPFSYSGIVWVTVTSKKPNNKRIELNVKNLKIRLENVTVLKSIRLTNNDFDEDLDWDLSEEDLYSLPRLNRRRRRQVDPAPDPPADEGNDGGEELDDERATGNGTTESGGPANLPSSSSGSVENATIVDRSKFYHHPVFPADDFVTIKILDIEFDESNEKMIIFLGTEMKKDIYYIVKVSFVGNMTNDKGLYYTHYEDDGPDHRHFAATVLEPNNARRLYPCMDDHNFRSPFELNIARRSDMNTASSMNLEMSEPMEEDGLVVDTYNTTDMVRASEIGFVVTDMVPERYRITARVSLLAFTRTRYDGYVQRATGVFSRVLQMYEAYLGVPFPYEVIRYVTIPNIDHATYEIKEGMVLSSEKRLVKAPDYFPPLDTAIDREVANELAKLFIHKLADYKNKETYWLHESLPLYLEALALRNMTTTNSTTLDDFLLEGRLRSMREEMNTKTSALNIFTNHWEEDTHFELVKYKGLSVLRMMNYTLGPEAFDLFVREYFRLRMESESVDVIDILNSGGDGAASRTDGVFHSFLHSWSSLEKYPIINIRRNNASGHFELRQIPLPFEEEPAEQLWTVPVTYINDTNQRLFVEKVRWLTDDENLLTVQYTCKANDNSPWIIVNPSGIGYYRVNYEPSHWVKLAHVLNRNFHYLPYTTLANIVDDALNLARLGLLNYSIAFDVVSFLKQNNEHYQPWKLALSNLEFVYHATEDLPSFRHVERFLEYLIVDKYNEIEHSNGSVHYNPAIRELIVQWACKLGVSTCIEQQKRLFQAIFYNRTVSPFGLREESLLRVLCTTVRYSGLPEWKRIEQQYLDTPDINYQRILIKSLGCTREISLIKRYLDLLRHPQFRMYSKEILTAVGDNKVALKYTLDFLFNEWVDVRLYLTLYDISILLRSIANMNEFKMYEQIFFRYSYTFQTMDKEILKRVRDIIIKLMVWRQAIAPVIVFRPYDFSTDLAAGDGMYL
uniref:G-protein coupled receptors family 2 profile 2 domain-containing protein n=1 Tax=Anopheles dirus TaxID=7168 RepID=A0A182NAG3_9DIPT